MNITVDICYLGYGLVGGVYISQYKIENVVASAFLGTELNLQDLAIFIGRCRLSPGAVPPDSFTA